MCNYHQQYNEILNLTTIINIFILFFNLIISLYLNFFAYKNRRNDDREYNTKYEFYKNLVITNIPFFTSMPDDISLSVQNVISQAYNENTPKENLRRSIENTCNSVEKCQETFYTKYNPLISCYSESMKEKFYNNCETFFDDSIKLISKLSEEQTHRTSAMIYTNNFSKIKQRYLKELFTLINSYSPNSKNI